MDYKEEIARKARSLALGVAVFISSLSALGFGIFNNYEQSLNNQQSAATNQQQIQELENKYERILISHSASGSASFISNIDPPDTHSCKCAKVEGDDVYFKACSISPSCDATTIEACEVMFSGYQCASNND